VRKLLPNIACALLTFVCGVAVARILSLGETKSPHASASNSEFDSTPISLTKLPCEVPPELPTAVKASLDKNFPGWQFPFVSNDIRRFLKERVSTDARPEVITGDFDGDGQLDYAVLIEYGEVAKTQEPPRPPGHDFYLVALLNRPSGYEMSRIGEGVEYLSLMKKGDRDHNYEADRYFHYAHDAIFAGHFEKGGTSYIYENGGFRAIITSD
jgi:hypothetical protein